MKKIYTEATGNSPKVSTPENPNVPKVRLSEPKRDQKPLKIGNNSIFGQLSDAIPEISGISEKFRVTG